MGEKVSCRNVVFPVPAFPVRKMLRFVYLTKSKANCRSLFVTVSILYPAIFNIYKSHSPESSSKPCNVMASAYNPAVSAPATFTVSSAASDNLQSFTSSR